MSKKVMFASKNFPYAVELLRNRLGGSFRVVTPSSSKELAEEVKDVEVIIPAMSKIDEQVIDAAAELDLIVQWGVGLEGVNKEYAAKKGIRVTNVPGENSLSVAECSLYLMFSLSRKQNYLEESFNNRRIGTPRGRELNGKNLLIVGLGSSGSKLARIGNGIGMNLKGIRKNPEKGGPEYVEVGGPEKLNDFLPWADFVSLNLPLTEATEGLFDEEKFKLMKDSAHIVNVSRGSIIEKDDLYDAIVDGEIAGAGLDVYWNEPPDPNDELYELKDVVTTPHIAGVTEEAYNRIADEISDIITDHYE